MKIRQIQIEKASMHAWSILRPPPVGVDSVDKFRSGPLSTSRPTSGGTRSGSGCGRRGRSASSRTGRSRTSRLRTAGSSAAATWRSTRGSRYDVDVVRYFILLHRARSRLYRRRSLEVDTYFSAFFDIYKMCILLHRCSLSNLSNFCQNVC